MTSKSPTCASSMALYSMFFTASSTPYPGSCRRPPLPTRLHALPGKLPQVGSSTGRYTYCSCPPAYSRALPKEHELRKLSQALQSSWPHACSSALLSTQYLGLRWLQRAEMLQKSAPWGRCCMGIMSPAATNMNAAECFAPAHARTPAHDAGRGLPDTSKLRHEQQTSVLRVGTLSLSHPQLCNPICSSTASQQIPATVPQWQAKQLTSGKHQPHCSRQVWKHHADSPK